MPRTVRNGPLINNGQHCDDEIDKIDAGKECGAILSEGHEAGTEDGRQAASDEPEPALGGAADAEPDEEGGEDRDDAGRGV